MKRSKKSLFNAMLVGFLSASMVLTTPAISWAQVFYDGNKVTVDASDIPDRIVDAANETEVTVNGSLSQDKDGKSIAASGGSTVTVKGDVGGDIECSDATVTVEGNVSGGSVVNEDGKVDISGNVNASYKDEDEHKAVTVQKGSETKVGGSVTLDSKSGGNGVLIEHFEREAPVNVSIGGDVNVSSTGLLAKPDYTDQPTTIYTTGVSVFAGKNDEINVNIAGKVNVKANADTQGIEIYTEDNAKVNITAGGVTADGAEQLDTGDSFVEMTQAIDMVNRGHANVNVVIKGDVKSNNEGVSISNGKDSATNTNIFVTGSIDAKDTAIRICNATDKSKVTVTAWEIKTSNEEADTIYVGKEGDRPHHFDYDKEATEKLTSDINYIIRHDGTIQLEGTTKTSVDGTTYETAKEKTELTIHVKVDGDASRYKVEGGSATATKNADGSWTLIVPKNGGVDIRAVLMAIEENKSQSSSSSSSSSSHSSSRDSAVTTTTTSDGATVQTTVTNTANANLTSAVISLGSASAKASTAVNRMNGGTATFKKASGNLAGANFQGVGQVSADGKTLVKEDGTTAKMAPGTLLCIRTNEGLTLGCFVDEEGDGHVIATGRNEVYYLLGTDGKLHAHFVDAQGYFLTGIQVINGHTVTFNAEGEMVSVL